LNWYLLIAYILYIIGIISIDFMVK
jgi:hypothetical protein